MGCAEGLGWHDVPTETSLQWRTIFDRSAEGINVTGECPICGASALHRYFNLHRSDPSTSDSSRWAGPGSQWQWCSNCRAYEHGSGLVPDWWEAPFTVPERELAHDPGSIEAARQLG